MSENIHKYTYTFTYIYIYIYIYIYTHTYVRTCIFIYIYIYTHMNNWIAMLTIWLFNIAMENPLFLWRFLAGNIIYFYGSSIPWRNVSHNQRVNPIKSHKTIIFIWFSYGFPMLNNERVSENKRSKHPIPSEHRGFGAITRQQSIAAAAQMLQNWVVIGENIAKYSIHGA